jgi:nicotinamidase-related amidase
VLAGPAGEGIAEKNIGFIHKLLDFDAVIIAGQAKSHCVAWTIDDLLNEIYISNKKLAEKVYILEDCTSPVVIPDVIDYTGPANKAFQKFADAGMHIVRSTDPIKSWPGMKP